MIGVVGALAERGWGANMGTSEGLIVCRSEQALQCASDLQEGGAPETGLETEQCGRPLRLSVNGALK